MGMLTVRENIEFSAALRLPHSTTASQRCEKVNEVIADLGLSACANMRVRFSDAVLKELLMAALVSPHRTIQKMNRKREQFISANRLV